jgi:hypothetical protein
LDRLERVVSQIAAASLKFRNEIRQTQPHTMRLIKTLAERQTETEEKLETLIDVGEIAARETSIWIH